MNRIIGVFAASFIFVTSVANGQTRDQILQDMLEKLNTGTGISQIEAAENGLLVDDKTIIQSFIESVLQHKDRKVRQVGFAYIARNIKHFNIIIDIPANIETMAGDKYLAIKYREHKNFIFSHNGYDEKSGYLKGDTSSPNAWVDQTGLVIRRNDIVFHFKEAEAGYILGSATLNNVSLPARIPLP